MTYVDYVIYLHSEQLDVFEDVGEAYDRLQSIDLSPDYEAILAKRVWDSEEMNDQLDEIDLATRYGDDEDDEQHTCAECGYTDYAYTGNFFERSDGSHVCLDCPQSLEGEEE